MKHKLRKGLAVGVICLLMLVSIPTTIGTEDFNIKVKVKPGRRVLPRIYSEDIWIFFNVGVINDGPNISSAYNVEFTITSIFGQSKGKEDYREEWTWGPNLPNTGMGRYIQYFTNSRGFFEVWKAQATIDVDDANPDDDTSSFVFIVVNYP
ncbi:MAG: hypothetical protein JSW06_06260 [Thermoplasmatales archaeon]|nr:MAG: hypothetical protein JSW06_06260 [Thermoplasmatales archaeon]